jgi:hypothetical protein
LEGGKTVRKLIQEFKNGESALVKMTTGEPIEGHVLPTRFERGLPTMFEIMGIPSMERVARDTPVTVYVEPPRPIYSEPKVVLTPTGEAVLAEYRLRAEANGGSEQGRPPTTKETPTIPAVESTATAQTDVDWKSVIAAVVDENALAIINIAQNTTKTTDQKMRAIYAIDNRALGWDSPKWAQVLRVTDAAIRKCDWWREDRLRLRE